ncbi:MAG: BREX-1 system adenine-specific DNA-methyltransferase PglX, partial [Ruminiclostridium sp.]|nr:BREX-1 system adenine-specific DNA-methyltransferase PglX [Ruminiclostridium sp.]
IRFMEVNDYLPHHTRVLSSATPGQSVPDIVSRALDIDLGLTVDEQQQVLAWKLDNQTDELFRFLFLKQCRQLAGLLPGLFDDQHATETDHLSLLLTISCVNPDGIVAELLKIPESYFDVNALDEEGQPIGQIEIIGWLYQYYNAELKDDTFARLKKNIKITKERIPAATQLFTPQWIVKYMVENSLGRLWAEKLLADGDPRSEKEIAAAFGWRYYLPEAEQEPQVAAQLKAMRKERQLQSPEDIRFIDPCMGSGHILVYAFDVLMQVYLSRGYGASEAARLIVQKNLHGLDIDDRAWQLAYFAVMMKARQHRHQALLEGLISNLHAVQDSQGLENKQLDYFGQGLSSLERNMARDQAVELLHLFRDGKLLGSIIQVPDWDFELLKRFARDFKLPRQVDLLSDLHAERAQPRLTQLVEIACILQQQYDAVVTNPPYMGSSGMNPALSSYVREEYADSKADLFAVFIERCGQMIKQTGYQAMITQHAWMFLSSYEKLREKLQQQMIVNMAHLGPRAFEEIAGEVVQSTAFVLGSKALLGYLGTYARLIEPTTQDGKEEMFLAGRNRYTADQQNFTKIPSAPVAYWANHAILAAFEKGQRMDTLVNPRQGLATADNDRFIRLWYEVHQRRSSFDSASADEALSSQKKWFPYNKGGERRQWYGNYDYLVNWENDGQEIKNFRDNNGKQRSVVRNPQYHFHEAITWGLITSGGFSIRYRTAGGIHDVSGMSAFTDNHQLMMYLLALMSTHLADYVFKMVNPTINLQIGDFNIFPVVKAKDKEDAIINMAEESIEIAKEDWDSFETSWNFKRHPML